MASAAPSSLASSVEKTNGAKLSRLLIDGGTTVLRKVFNSYHPPAKLAAGLTANYLTLSVLLRKKVLRTAQWDQLFPPLGAPPDSHTFDITLLFLLLTNICGLTPPSSGWHTKPLPSDTSLEANLARVKLFRNELYGHVSTTGVNMPTFLSLWQEISAVLVALGLDQVEIDRLKAEHGGEEEYHDLLRGWSESEEDIKSQLRDISHFQTQVHEDVEDLRRRQIEDHTTLEDTKIKLEELSQCQTKTLSAVEEVQQGIEEFKQVAESEKNRREVDREAEVLSNLAKVEFKGDIEYHAQSFQEGTREWMFNKIDEWLDNKSSPNRVMVISGNAGMGKSVISAVVCKRMQHAGRLSGSHFCQHNNVRYSKPQLMLQSLAVHLTQTLPEYKKALVEQLSRNLGVHLNSMGVEELFALLFKEPLSTVKDPERNILMVVDGLDESEYQGRNELLDVVANQFCKLPEWIRFLVTTRPEINIAESLKHLQPIQLDENQAENVRDIALFFEMRLGSKIEEEHKNILLKKLVERSEGVFLYASFLITFFEENVSLLTLKQVENSLPLGISSVYLSHFKRLERELCGELKVDEEQVLRFLCALTASREPLPVAFVSRILKPSGKSLGAQRRVNKAIACISTLLPIRDDRLHFVHKSVKDWLTNTSSYGQHDFIVDKKEGHEILFNLCTAELDNIKRKGPLNSQFNDAEKYALQHGVQHMIEADGLGESTITYNVDYVIKTYVTDLELIYAKLCVNSAVPSEDLLSVLKEVKPALLNDESCSLLTDLSKLLRKHSFLLSGHSHLLFQSLVNEGSPKLSSSAAMILETELPNVSYLTYAHAERQEERVQARFFCSDTVACFDVSPKMDYLVCECRDGTMHLWSLQTGNKEWKRPSLVKREFEVLADSYRKSNNAEAYRKIYNVLTFYRSVVFHPSGTCVLPGNLQNVYTLNGDCDDLFPESSCTFAHSVYPEDKKIILTDCCDDPRKICLWSLDDGQQKWSITFSENISSFTISKDGSLISFADVTGSIYLVDLDTECRRCLFRIKHTPCELMHFTPDYNALVCGYLPFIIEDLGNRYGWVCNGEPDFIFCQFRREDISTSSSEGATLRLDGSFFLWPIDQRTLTLGDFFIQTPGTCFDKSVRSVFPSMPVGFYKKLSEETTLVGSPCHTYIALVNVCNRDEEPHDSVSRREVIEVVLSREGDTIYSITSDENRTSEVTVFRMSNQDILVSKRSFTASSLSLLSMKEGVVLCIGNEIPELWNFDLTKCIRPLTKLSGARKLTQVSHDLIACQWHCRKLTHEERFNQSSEVTDTLEPNLSMETDASFDIDERSGVHDSSDSSDGAFSLALFQFSIMQTALRFMYLEAFQMLVVDIFNVATGEFVSSVKTRVHCEKNIEFVYCNSKNQLLVCTCEEKEDDLYEIDELKVSLRNNNSLTSLWERSWKRYEYCYFTPHFMFSPEEELVITWNSLSYAYGLHILDVRCGKTVLTLLKNHSDIVDCKFVCDGESLLCCSRDSFLRLFNVRSGDLLCLLDIEEQPFSLGACLGNHLVAVGLSGARLKFIHAVLPRVKDSEKKKGRHRVATDLSLN